MFSRFHGSFLFVALANLLQRKARLAVALVGTGVPVVLLCLQIASLNAARIQVTRLYDDFNFDLAIVPSTYQFLVESGSFDRVRFTQARAIPGVAETFSLNVAANNWTDAATDRRSTLLLVGVDTNENFVRDPAIRAGLKSLTNNRSILIDDFSSVDYGKIATGTEGTISERSAEIAGHFQLGLFFYADGGAIARNDDFPAFAGRDPQMTSIGLVRLDKGADAASVKDQLVHTLPDDVRVLTRSELIEGERAFFISTKPIGIMLTISMWIAFLVGSVILWQVLSADVINRIKEFATLKAMGFSQSYVLGIGLAEAIMLALGSFLPAFAISAAILWTIERLTHLPTAITPSLTVTVLGIVLSMCILSAVAAVRRIARAAPAELYR